MGDYLNHMAVLVRENPNITVNQMAKALSFADPTSVYYWLDQASYQGIKEFKTRVLSSSLESPLLGYSLDQQGVRCFLHPIPIMRWDGKEDKEQSPFYLLGERSTTYGLFATIVETDELQPWFFRDDILIVDTNTRSSSGWLLVKERKGFRALRCCSCNELLDPASLELIHRIEKKVVGTIIRQQRDLG